MRTFERHLKVKKENDRLHAADRSIGLMGQQVLEFNVIRWPPFSDCKPMGRRQETMRGIRDACRETC